MEDWYLFFFKLYTPFKDALSFYLFLFLLLSTMKILNSKKDRRGRDRMVVGFTTICAISADHQ